VRSVELETSGSPSTETAKASGGLLLSGVAYGGFEARCEREERRERCLTRKKRCFPRKERERVGNEVSHF
jgi:hypothetical protein